ncbi:MAG: 16S rRNA (cytosine(1402)-N(4))-methyltransferase RsmH [Candidatus Omnitrophota bacterium]
MHLPVLLQEVVESLDLKRGDVILDATFGGGGHAAEILKNIVPGGKLIAVDKDPEAVERARRLSKDFQDAIVCVNDDFRNVTAFLERVNLNYIDGAVFDLGMSSFQVDDTCRGFSFLKDGPLDMRYDSRQKFSAEDAVNRLSREELMDLIRKYGEERHAMLVAGAICSARKKERITTTGALRGIIQAAIGRKYRSQHLHPACRTFQALRIYVNDELDALADAVRQAIMLLRPGRRICVISFHSLEDRIIKNTYRDMAAERHVTIITRKPLIPKVEEIRLNPRSRSAKLRVAERTAL